MKVLNLLASGGIGGIEVLCKDMGINGEFQNTFCFLFDTGIIYNEMKELGMELFDLSNMKTSEKMKKLLSLSKKYDIVVVHHGSLGMHFFFDFLMAFNKKSKFILMHHSCFEKSIYYGYNSQWKNILRKFVLEYAIKHSDRIVYVSNAGKQSFLSSFKIDEDKTQVVYNGISEELLYKGKKNNPIFKEKINLLYIGRLAETKGVHLLIKSIAELKEKMQLDVKIVGGGEQEEVLRKMAKEENVDEIISFEGAVRDKTKYYEWANVFIYPSVWQEVFGISIVEALAYGIPCIANRVGGIPEIVNDGNGVLTNTSDIKGISDAIRTILKKYENGEIANMSKAAKITATHFSISSTVNQMQRIFEDLVK